MLVSASLPSLANGLSQQPATARLSSQGEDQINGYSSIVEGLGKRPPTHHIAQMISAGEAPDGAFLHMINRDVDERYSVIIANGVIRVFDLEGVEKTVSDDADDGYLDAADDTTAFRAVTIADYTFLLNREKTVAMAEIGTTWTLVVNASHATGAYRVYLEVDAAGVFHEELVTVVATDNTANTLAAAINTAFNALGTSSICASTVSTNTVTFVNATSKIWPFRLYLDVAAPGLDADLTLTKTKHQDYLRAMAYVKQGNYATLYQLTIDGIYASNAASFNVVVSNTTANTDITTIKTDVIAGALNTALQANSVMNTNFTITQVGSVIAIEANRALVTSFTLRAIDSNGNKNLIPIKDSIQKFTDLPNQALDNFVVKITGDAAAEEDDYYVQFDGDRGGVIGGGVWEETYAHEETIDFARETMPHLLIRQADGTFTFEKADWDARGAGSADSNPEPTFVGTTMNDIVFFRNRLGFLADESVIMSAVGPHYFRFWRATVTTVLDGDPIDVAASNVSVSILRNAVPFSGDKMLLFSDQKQFIFSGGDLLTPKTAAIKPSTAYETLVDCKPVSVGKMVYFPTPRGDNAGIREYGTDATTSVDDATDITAHVPAYVPANVYKIFAASGEDLIGVLSRDEPTSIFVYKFFFVANDKLQASWSKWTFDGDVLDANFIGTTMYVAVDRVDGVYLERLEVEPFRNDENMAYEVLLDRRLFAGPAVTDLIEGTYSAVGNRTTFTLPYLIANTESFQAVVRDDGAIPSGYYESQVLTVTRAAGATTNTVYIAGDVSDVPLILGIPYTFTYEFSEIVLKQAAGQGGERPLTGGRLQLRTLNLVFDRTGYFRVTVTPTYGDTYTYTLTPKILGEYVTGTMVLQAGEFKVPVMSKSDEVVIQVINDSPYPVHLLSATWEGEFILKTKRM